MEIKIRNAKPGDAPFWEQIRADGWEYAYRGVLEDGYLDAQKNKFLSIVDKRRELLQNSDGINLVAVNKDNVPVGFVSGGKNTEQDKKKEFYIGGLYLNPKYIGTGLGKKLFFEFARRVIEEGGNKFTSGCLENNKSRGFYEKLGGKVIRKEPFQNQTELFFEFKASDLLK